jgi:hypothetical protein
MCIVWTMTASVATLERQLERITDIPNPAAQRLFMRIVAALEAARTPAALGALSGGLPMSPTASWSG